MSKVKRILISQPEPKTENSPYDRIKKKANVDFIPFISVEPEDSRSLRENQIKLSDFTSVIMTSRNAIDHFFRIAGEMRYQVPNSLRYFCVSEAVATYLQKYVVYRKRKIYAGGKTILDLVPYLKVNKNEKYFLPSSDVLSCTVSKALDSAGIDWVRGILYRTVSADLSKIKDISYDMLVFFTPSGVESFFKNFPDFEQNDMSIAAFGDSTIKTATEAGLNVNVKAPTKESPSMIMALEKYLENN